MKNALFLHKMVEFTLSFSYDSRRVKEILSIPERYGVPLMVATGYEYGAHHVVHADTSQDEDSLFDRKLQRLTPRLEMDELFFGDKFGEPLDLLKAEQVEENVA